MNIRLLLLAAATLLGACAAANPTSGLPLKRIADVTLPGNPTRLDYQSLDPERHLLFVAHLGDSAVIVLDTKARHITAVIPNVANVHGVLVVPMQNTAYASATGTNEVVAIDESTFRIKWRAPAGTYPDCIAYDPNTNRLFVSDEHGNTDTVIDASRGRGIATIPLGGEVGNTQYDARSHHMFVNAEGTGELVEIDPGTNRILRRADLPGCAGNHGLLIDAARRRAFVACEDNAAFLWIDLPSMKIKQRWTIGSDPDVLALDERDHVVYVAAESGVIAMFRDDNHVTSFKALLRQQRIPFRPNPTLESPTGHYKTSGGGRYYELWS